MANETVLECLKSLQTPGTLSCTNPSDNSTITLACQDWKHNEEIQAVCNYTPLNPILRVFTDHPLAAFFMLLATLLLVGQVLHSIYRNGLRGLKSLAIGLLGGLAFNQLIHFLFKGTDWELTVLVFWFWAVVALSLLLHLRSWLAPANTDTSARQPSLQEEEEEGLPFQKDVFLQDERTDLEKGK